MFWTSSPKRRWQLTLALLVGLVVIVSILDSRHGSEPEAGATYTGTVVVDTPAGTVVQHLPVSFAVDGSGQRVVAFRFPAGLPSACAASKLGAATAVAGSAEITSGRFSLSLAITGTHRRMGTLEISGVFGILHRESGGVATRYSAPDLRGCDASGGYTARASQ